jgi:hypothetical protein
MPIFLGIVGVLAVVAIGYAVSGSSSSNSTTAAAGKWQALVAPFTIAPGASVVVVDPQTMTQPVAGYPSGVTPLSTTLQNLAQIGAITNYQMFAPGTPLPSDWPTADTYGTTVQRYEFTYPATYTPTGATQGTTIANTPLTLPTSPVAAWQLVPA